MRGKRIYFKQDVVSAAAAHDRPLPPSFGPSPPPPQTCLTSSGPPPPMPTFISPHASRLPASPPMLSSYGHTFGQDLKRKSPSTNDTNLDMQSLKEQPEAHGDSLKIKTSND